MTEEEFIPGREALQRARATRAKAVVALARAEDTVRWVQERLVEAKKAVVDAEAEVALERDRVERRERAQASQRATNAKVEGEERSRLHAQMQAAFRGNDSQKTIQRGQRVWIASRTENYYVELAQDTAIEGKAGTYLVSFNDGTRTFSITGVIYAIGTPEGEEIEVILPKKIQMGDRVAITKSNGSIHTGVLAQDEEIEGTYGKFLVTHSGTGHAVHCTGTITREAAQ